MAVSFRVVIYLIALLVGGLFYAIVGDAVDVLEPMVSQGVSTESSEKGYRWVSRIWVIGPVFMIIAASAWLLKQGVVTDAR